MIDNFENREPIREKAIPIVFVPTDDCEAPKTAKEISYVLLGTQEMKHPLVLFAGNLKGEPYIRHEELLELAEEDIDSPKFLGIIRRGRISLNFRPRAEDVDDIRVLGGGVAQVNNDSGRLTVTKKGTSQSYDMIWPSVEEEILDTLEDRLNKKNPEEYDQ